MCTREGGRLGGGGGGGGSLEAQQSPLQTLSIIILDE